MLIIIHRPWRYVVRGSEHHVPHWGAGSERSCVCSTFCWGLASPDETFSGQPHVKAKP